MIAFIIFLIETEAIGQEERSESTDTLVLWLCHRLTIHRWLQDGFGFSFFSPGRFNVEAHALGTCSSPGWLPSKHCRNATFKKIFFFFFIYSPVGRISLATLPPFLCGGGGKLQNINQRQVLMQGSAQWGALVLPRGWVDSIQPPVRPPADCVPPARGLLLPACASTVISWAALRNGALHWPGFKNKHAVPSLAEGELGFPQLASQVEAGAARQGRVTLKKPGIWDGKSAARIEPQQKHLK